MRKIFTVILMLIANQLMAQSIQKGPYLTRVTDHSMYINWQTTADDISRVTFGIFDVAENEIIESNAKSIHQIKLGGLQPETQYAYRIYSATDSSEIYYFRTLPVSPQAFTFAAFGDNRSDSSPDGNDVINCQNVLNAMASADPLFAIHTGDIVYRGYKEQYWQWYWDVAKQFFAEFPVYFSPGNHEDLDKASYYYQYMNLPYNNPDSTEGYYSFNVGGVHFIALNSTGDDMDYHVGSPQYVWLQNDLQAAQSQDFIVVYFHFPLYSTGGHGSQGWLAAEWEDLFIQNGVDLVLSGHDHSYERTIPIGGVTYMVTGGAGAPLYSQDNPANWSAVYEKAMHFTRIDVNGSEMTVTMIRPDGSIGDQFTLTSGTTTSVDEPDAFTADNFELQQNYPNPFNGRTRIDYYLPQAGNIKIEVFNTLGQKVARLVEGLKSAGAHHVYFHTNDLPSGAYFYTFSSGSYKETRKMMYLK